MSAEPIHDLEEYLDDALAPDGAPTVVGGVTDKPWSIDDEGSADWAARKVIAARKQIAEKEAQARRIIEQAKNWLDRETDRLESEAEFFEFKLGDWLRREIAADTSKKPRKSRDLPCGARVKCNAGRQTVEVDNEDQLVDWLKDNRPQLVTSTIVWKYSKTDVKKAFDATADDDLGQALLVADGEPVPGVRLVRSPDSYSVVTPEGGDR